MAKIAAWQMKANRVAIVIGHTIHLHNVSRQEFLAHKKWLRHEVAHVHQWREMGKIRFLMAYLFESFNKGYYNNRFEVEARKKETDVTILIDIEII